MSKNKQQNETQEKDKIESVIEDEIIDNDLERLESEIKILKAEARKIKNKGSYKAIYEELRKRTADLNRKFIAEKEFTIDEAKIALKVILNEVLLQFD